MLVCRCALVAFLFVTPCFAGDTQNKRNSALKPVSTLEEPLAEASEEAGNTAEANSVRELLKAIKKLEKRIAKLEQRAKRDPGRKSGRSKAVTSKRQLAHPDGSLAASEDVAEFELRLFQLQKADADQLAKMIRALFAYPVGNGLAVEADSRTNSIVARGTKAQLSALKSLVQSIDVEARGNGNEPGESSISQQQSHQPPTLAEQVVGTWVLTEAKNPGNPSGIGTRLKTHTPTHWVVTQPDPETGEVIFHLGGRYSLDGDTVNGTTDFAVPRLKSQIGQTGKSKFELHGETLRQLDSEGNWIETWTRWKPTERFPEPE